MTNRDTSAEARAVQLAALRALGGAGRVAQTIEMSERAREIAVQGWLDRNPGAERRQAVAAMRRRLLGDRLYEAAYPDSRVD